jgi:hypothetical protein
MYNYEAAAGGEAPNSAAAAALRRISPAPLDDRPQSRQFSVTSTGGRHAERRPPPARRGIEQTQGHQRTLQFRALEGGGSGWRRPPDSIKPAAGERCGHPPAQRARGTPVVRQSSPHGRAQIRQPAMKLLSLAAVLCIAALTTAEAQTISPSAPACVFTSTHCVCSPKTAGGTCFRHRTGPQTNGRCTVEACSAGGYKCDCLGKDFCEIKACGTWKASPAHAAGGFGPGDVPCVFSDESTCMAKVDRALTPATAPPTPHTTALPTTRSTTHPTTRPTTHPTTYPTTHPTTHPTTQATTYHTTHPTTHPTTHQTTHPTTQRVHTYKQVQLGAKSASNMFNLTYQVDENDEMVASFDRGAGRAMNNRWPDSASLKPRQLNVRLYKSASGENRFACTVINTYGIADDGLGNYMVDTTIRSLNGNVLRFVQCDDWTAPAGPGECNLPLSGPTLTASHRGLPTSTDGWCVSLPDDGSGISIKYTGIMKLNGINFLGSDGARTEYPFQGSQDGLTGLVDSDGLVTGGEVPEIIVNPAGIAVP